MFKTVGIFGKYQDNASQQAVSELSEHLAQRGIRPLPAEPVEDAAGEAGVDEDMLAQIDLGVVIGGDGTLLHVARNLARHQVPVVGVNMGRLGFLTDIALTNMRRDIDRIMDGEYSIEERMMLQVRVMEDDELILADTALNDVIIGRHASEKLIEWHAYVDGDFVTSSRSDGVIVATPTGSTAYALSAGGPIMSPQLDAIVMVPICPHTLSNRPIALGGASRFEFRLVGIGPHDARVSVDGLIKHHFSGDEVVRVTRAEETVKLVRTHGHDHFAMLRAKLGWGEDRNLAK